ncbi:hypothetical protein RYX36_023828 [Vicia faba]
MLKISQLPINTNRSQKSITTSSLIFHVQTLSKTFPLFRKSTTKYLPFAILMVTPTTKTLFPLCFHDSSLKLTLFPSIFSQTSSPKTQRRSSHRHHLPRDQPPSLPFPNVICSSFHHHHSISPLRKVIVVSLRPSTDIPLCSSV